MMPEINGPTELDKAYAAGILDGEGCISYNTSSNFSIIIVIEMAAPVVIEWFHKNFGGKRCLVNCKYGVDHRWYVSNYRDVASFLNLVRPYMKLKSAQADIALAMCATFSEGRSRVSEHTFATRAALAATLGQLNTCRPPLPTLESEVK